MVKNEALRHRLKEIWAARASLDLFSLFVCSL